MVELENPGICAVITGSDLAAIREVAPLVALFEVRIDLIGDGWPEVVGQLDKPWLACNRLAQEGGGWRHSEARRKEELLRAVEMGAAIVDVELATPNLERLVPMVKKGARCLISFHELEKTPPLPGLKKVVEHQLAAGADICKVVTTARKFEDNLTIMRLITEFPEVELVAFAMGPGGLTSRILSPLVGGSFTYAALERGAESAPGQITVAELDSLYKLVAP